jgi:extracellular factor (EF) 3-hydroxypalmitic acid methyl ester biosynthesis protein
MHTIAPILDKALKLCRKDCFQDAGDILLYDLFDFRFNAGIPAWFDTHVPDARRHELMTVMQECPFTRHSYEKPRGYAGDALLIDYLYREDTVADRVKQATPAGRAIHDYWTSTPGADGVRNRREIIGHLIDETAVRSEEPTIFSVACGHLREASRSTAVKDGKIKRFVVLDQDGQSLAFVKRALPDLAVTTVNRSIRGIIAGKEHYGSFDLIYASGLYDYLNARVARRLTANLFKMLRAEGALVVPNFLDTVANLASMEAFMDWRLICRDRAAIEDCAGELRNSTVASLDYFAESSGNIGFMVIRRT